MRNEIAPAGTTTGAVDTGDGGGAPSYAVGSSGLWSTAGSLIPQIYAVVSSVVVARYLGPDGVGELAFIVFVQFTITQLLSGGLPLAVMRFVAEAVGRNRASDIPKLYRWGGRRQLAAAILGAAVLLTLAMLGAEPPLAWTFAAIACLGATMQPLSACVLSGLNRWRGATLVGLTTGALAVLAKVVVLEAGFGTSGVYAVLAAMAVTNAVATALLAHTAIRGIPSDDAPVGELLRRARRFAGLAWLGALLTLVIWNRSEIFFLSHFSSDSEVGFYSIAFSAALVFTAAAQAFAAPFISAFAALTGADASERIRELYGRSLRLALFVAIPLTALAVVAARPAIDTLYGPEFSDAALPAVLLLLPLPAVVLLRITASLLDGLGRQRAQILVGFAAAAVTITLDLLLIPPHGAVGAAVANDIGQLCAALPLVLYGTRVAGPLAWTPSTLAKTLAAAVVAGALASVAARAVPEGAIALAVVLVTFAAAYTLLMRVSRPLPSADAGTVRQAGGPRIVSLFGRALEFCAAEPRTPTVGAQR